MRKAVWRSGPAGCSAATRTASGATRLDRSRRRSPAWARTTRATTSPRELDVWGGVTVAPFGTPGRDAEIQRLFGSDPPVAAYAPLYRIARRVVGRAPTPYAAAVALEAWFRSGGGFVYDEQPPQAAGMPALVGFVTKTRAGYCQHYAGAMALMLRYLGIPARVAGGFTSGRWNRDRERWIVSDTDAHAWVEVWFPGYGWLPFDPTPSRGSFDAPYSNASASFDAGAAVTALGAGGGLGLEALLKLARQHNRPPDRRGRRPPGGRRLVGQRAERTLGRPRARPARRAAARDRDRDGEVDAPPAALPGA